MWHLANPTAISVLWEEETSSFHCTTRWIHVGDSPCIGHHQDAVGRRVGTFLPGSWHCDGLCYPPCSWNPPLGLVNCAGLPCSLRIGDWCKALFLIAIYRGETSLSLQSPSRPPMMHSTFGLMRIP